MECCQLKFSLFSSGKYHLDSVPCTKIHKSKKSTILELLFIEGIRDKDAKLYSIYKCYEQKRKICLCEICWFLAKYNMSKEICKRYKTKGTPHFPLDVMPIDCPYFKIDKEIESMAKLNYGNNIIIKE